MKKIVILGSTGSIGKSTLAVIEQNKADYEIFALVGGKNVEEMAAQCLLFQPKFAALDDESAATALKVQLASFNIKTEIVAGKQAICDLSAHPEVDMVMAAIVGAAGLLPTLAAVKAGKKVLLANKESLVTCGQLFIDEAKKSGAQILPVDSEHNAIFQSLPVEAQNKVGFCPLAELGVSKIILTGSGGPFRTKPLDEFSAITPAQAIAHPNWSMGKKISVDSASADEMEIIIHPQSIIHSMVRYIDGSVIAQMGNPDMCTPIAHSMAYPNRINAGVAPLDFFKLKELTFIEPDFARYPNLKLAIDAFAAGQYATTAMNAANEIAVDAFLNEQIRFTDIAQVNRQVVENIAPIQIRQIEDVLHIDKLARELAQQAVINL